MRRAPEGARHLPPQNETRTHCAPASSNSEAVLRRHAEQVAVAFEVADETGMRLIVVPCGETGAYNMPFAIYGGRGDRISRTVFPLKFSETTGDTAFNIRYDATQRLFTSFVKGRGMGDCGSYYAWHIAEPGSADLLVLEEVRIKEECDAKADGGPATWPLAWKRQ